MSKPTERKERMLRERETLTLAFGAVIRYHLRWLFAIVMAFAGPWIFRGFAEWALPVHPWITIAVDAASLLCWLCGVALFFVLISKVGRLGKRLVARECLRCGYPLPEGVGKRCSECGNFAEIALAPLSADE